MKKIITVMAAILTISVANAADIRWQSPATAILNSTNLPSGAVAYLFDASVVSAATVEAAIKDGTFMTALIDNNKHAATDMTLSTGAILLDKDMTSWLPGQEKTLFMVIFNASTFGTATQFKLTDAITDELSAGQTTFNFGSGGASSPFALAPWQPVPEPATMALLGIGIVAVGLRRRRK